MSTQAKKNATTTTAQVPAGQFRPSKGRYLPAELVRQLVAERRDRMAMRRRLGRLPAAARRVEWADAWSAYVNGA